MTSKAPLTPLLLVGIFTSLFIGGTLLLAFTFFTEPRSSLVLAGITFVCWVEFLMGIMIGAFLVKSYFGNGFSGAITAILLKATTLYGLIGVITLIAFALFPESQQRDNLFGAAIFFESIFFFAVGAALIYFDTRNRADQEQVLSKREEHATKSYDLSGILLSMRNTKLEEAEALLRFDRLMKKLQNAEQCLSHSHGGGLADKVPDFESLDQQISKTIEKLTQSSTTLVQAGTDFSEENLQKMEEDTSSLHSLLARARLL
jgi:hypothetical protein